VDWPEGLTESFQIERVTSVPTYYSELPVYFLFLNFSLERENFGKTYLTFMESVREPSLSAVFSLFLFNFFASKDNAGWSRRGKV
jgi:hypothetical protein